MPVRRIPIPAVGAPLAAGLVLLASLRVGVLAPLALLACAATVLLLSRPALALAVAVGLPVLVESESDWGPSTAPARLYELIPGTKLSPVEALVLLALAATLLDQRRGTTPRRFGAALGAPLALLGLALLAGSVTGYYAGIGPSGLVNALRAPVLLLVVPLVVFRVVGTNVSLHRALGFLLALAVAKGVLGVLALVTGQTADSIGDQPLTYYEAPANLLVMLGLLFWACAALRRIPLPTWVWAGVPFMGASLLLSYRRSFWVATVLGLVLVLLFAVGRQSRRLGIPVVVALAAALGLTLSGQLSSGLTSSAPPTTSQGVGGRLQSLSPTAISTSKDDRYRTGERRNVMAALEEAPVAGLGLGISYPARYPLSIGNIPRDYVHFAVLWWWMKCGILGLVGYVWFTLAAIWVAARVQRTHPDATVRAAALGAAAGLVGYAVAETTATFTGPDPRSSLLVGAVLGLLAVAQAQAQDTGGPPDR